MGTFSLPQVGDSNSNICRGSNYSDSGGWEWMYAGRGPGWGHGLGIDCYSHERL